MELLTKKAIKEAAAAHALDALGKDQFNKNKVAVRSIKDDFTAGAELVLTTFKMLTFNTGDHGHELIADERQSQIQRGYDAKHDDKEIEGQLAKAAALYTADQTDLAKHTSGLGWPWSEKSYPDKRGKIDRKRQLVIAGALIAAEIDRLQRLEASNA